MINGSILKSFEEFELNNQPRINEIDSIPFLMSLPADYIEFMKTANGGNGFINNEHLILFSAKEILEINVIAKIEEYAPGLLIFGSNGGGQSYAFDLRDTAARIVKFYDMDIGDDEPEYCSDSFEGFLIYLAQRDPIEGKYF